MAKTYGVYIKVGGKVLKSPKEFHSRHDAFMLKRYWQNKGYNVSVRSKESK